MSTPSSAQGFAGSAGSEMESPSYEDTESSNSEAIDVNTLQNSENSHHSRELMDALLTHYSAAELDASMAAEHEVLGTKAVRYVVQKDPAVVQAAVQGMQDALAALPEDTTAAFRHAQQIAPELVEKETPMTRFLLASDYDFWAAAQMFADYWKERREVYGDDRYCRPLTLFHGPEESALDETAIQVLTSGHFAILPPDRFGRFVLFMDDESKLCEAYRYNHDNARVKIFFYLLHVISEQDGGVYRGYVAFFVISTNKNKPHVVRDGSAGRFLNTTHVPAPHRAHHIVACRKSTFVERQFIAFQSMIARTARGKSHMRIHFVGDLSRIIPDHLGTYGFGQQHIPISMCGKADVMAWSLERKMIEQHRYRPAVPSVVVAEEDTQTREKRQMARFQSWAAQHLASHKKRQLRQQVSDLEERNIQLVQQEALLEAQVVCAQHVAERYEQDKQRVCRSLVDCLSALPGIGLQVCPEDDCTSDENEGNVLPSESSALQSGAIKAATRLLDRFLLFLGRSPLNGEWLLEVKPGLSPEQQQFSLGLRVSLLERLAKPPEAQINEWVDAIPTEEDYSSQEDLDGALGLLKRKIERLKEERESAQRENGFLSSSLVVATQLSFAFEQYRLKHYGQLAGYYAGALALWADQVFGGAQNLALYVQALAGFVLSQYTIWNGEAFENPIVVLIGREAKTTEAMETARRTALQAVEPLMSQVLQKPMEELEKKKRQNEAKEAVNKAKREAARKQYRKERKKGLQRLRL